METSLNFLLAHCEQILSSLESPQNQNHFLNILETLLPTSGVNNNAVDTGASGSKCHRVVHPDWLWPALSKMVLVVQSCESEEEINGVFDSILPLLKPSVYLKLQQLQTTGDGAGSGGIGDHGSTSTIEDVDGGIGVVSSPDKISPRQISATRFNAWTVLKESQRKANAKCVDAEEISSLFWRRGGDPSSADRSVEIGKLASRIVAVSSETPTTGNESSQNRVVGGVDYDDGGGGGDERDAFRQMLTWILDGESRKLGAEALKLIPKLAAMNNALHRSKIDEGGGGDGGGGGR